jgi:hypothetical protein
LKLSYYIFTCFILLVTQGVRASNETKAEVNPLQNVVMELLLSNGVTREMKVPECVISNKLDGVVARRIDATRTTLWIGESAHDGIAQWSAGLYTLSRGAIEAELRFYNPSKSTMVLPKWAIGCGTNIQANTVLSFSQQWLPAHTNLMPAVTSIPPPSQSAKALVKKAIAFRKKGEGAKASKSLRMALLAEPLDIWSVVERTFLEDDGEGAIQSLIKNRANPAILFESVCNAYLDESSFKEVEVLLAQAQDFPEFEKVRESVKLRLQSKRKGEEKSK